MATEKGFSNLIIEAFSYFLNYPVIVALNGALHGPEMTEKFNCYEQKF